jgi:hypothetical protein
VHFCAEDDRILLIVDLNINGSRPGLRQ